MSVLVTGGSGFVGLNLLEHLLGRGETVWNYSLTPPPEAAAARFARLPGTLHALTGDVTDAAHLAAALRQSGAERLIHAAVITAGQQRERTDPERILAVNVQGTLNVLTAAQQHGVQRLIYVSSGSVYGASGFAAPRLHEEIPPQPDTLYAITKYAAERVSLRLGALSGLSVVAMRLGAVFGRWEHDTGARDTLSPMLRTSELAEAGYEAVLGEAWRRDWIYAPDVAAGIVAVLDLPAPAHSVYNVGSGVEWSVQDWCLRLQAHFPAFSHRVADAPGEAGAGLVPYSFRAPLETERLAAETGFRVRFGLEEAFADYMAWREEVRL